MSEIGFHIHRVALTGTHVVDAEVHFHSGINVVSGPSDTGKSYILHCIDFALGASTIPADIPEAADYENVVLDIRSNADGSQFTLTRSIRGGDAILKYASGEESTLGSKHAAGRDDTISNFLLILAGLADREIRKNDRGETRTLSFRDLAHLAIISEQAVIRERSPLHTGNPILRTAERSVFRLLLSGTDDSTVIPSEDRRISRARTEAKAEVLEGMLVQLREELASIGQSEDLQGILERLQRLDTSYREAEEELSRAGETLSTIEAQRTSLWQRRRSVHARMDLLSGLTERFSLLEAQYNSDLRRLDAIVETGLRLNDFDVVRCSVCGALPEHHDSAHRDTVAPELVSGAAQAEAAKIRTLLNDLESTRQGIREETAQLGSELIILEQESERVSVLLAEMARPHANEAANMLRSISSAREETRRRFDLLEREDELEGRLEEVSKLDTASARQEFSSVSASDTENFALEVQERLEAWNFPHLGRVTFSDEDWDIIVTGRRRSSHGKGVRAVTHAAFTAALLRYCTSRKTGHAGFVAIDSPLVVYREPDAEAENLGANVKDSFFRDLAATFSDDQVLIFENEMPPEDLVRDGSINLIQFTGGDGGRSGFIPRRESET